MFACAMHSTAQHESHFFFQQLPYNLKATDERTRHIVLTS